MSENEVAVAHVIELIETLKESPPDFIQKNGAWLISVIGIASACVGGIFTYFLKSRCTEINVCGILGCKRAPVALEASDIEVGTETNPEV